MELEKLIVPLMMDGSNFFKTASDAESKAGSLGGKLASIGGGIVTGGIALAGAGIVALGGYLAGAVQGAAEAEQIQSQLNSVLESTGYKAGMTADSVNALATSLSQVTPFEDDVITSGENMLLTFTNIGQSVFPAATETMLNMSTALGTDLQGSAMQLGKALNDPIAGIGALTRVGVTFTDGQKEAIKAMVEMGDTAGAQKIILAELDTEFGGSARAAGNTFAGQLQIAKNAIAGVGDTIGGALLPILTPLIKQFTEWLKSPEVNKGIQDFAAFLKDVLIPVILWVIRAVGDVIGFLFNLGVGIGRLIADFIKPFVDSWNAVTGAIKSVSDWVKKLGDDLLNLIIPDWLRPGSPTPFEMGLRGIKSAMQDLTKQALPELSTQLSLQGITSPIQNSISPSNDNSEIVTLLKQLNSKTSLNSKDIGLAVRDAVLQATG